MRFETRGGYFYMSTSTGKSRGRHRRPSAVRRWVANRASSSLRGGKNGRRKALGIAIEAFVLLLIISCASQLGNSTPPGNASQAPTIAPTRTAGPAPGAAIVKTVKKHPAKTGTTAAARSRAAAATAPAAAPSTHTAQATQAAPPAPVQTTPAAAPTPSAAPAGCHPLSDEGTCYEPGEYCRDSDHGLSGVAGDGKAITCEDNDGWRWEPS